MQKIFHFRHRFRVAMLSTAWLFGFLFLMGSVGSQTYDGYTLYFPQGGTKAYLVDLSGNTYHTWTFSASKQTCYASYLLAGGVLLRTVNHQGNSFTGGPISGEVQKVDWNGNVLWDFVYSTTDYCSHHDIHGMPNGNVLLIAYERKSAAQVTQAGCSQGIEMWPDKIVEIQPSGTSGGTVVWEWHAWDHLVQNFDPAKSNYGVVADHPELLNINYHTSKDWMHMNGVDYNETLDQVTFSSHALNEIYVIDHSTTTAEAASHAGGNSGKGGDLLYRWGNPAAYNTAGTTDFNVVHDAHWVPADNPLFPNALGGFNNKGGTGGKTCVDLVNPPYNGYNYTLVPGTAYAPATYDWRNTYSGNTSPDNGNSQQLPNGNTLICIGMSGFIYEIDSNQVQVWSKSAGSTLAQSFRYPPCFITGTYGATATGSPATIAPGGSSQLGVSVTGGVAYTYSWMSNPPGFSSGLQNPVVSPAATTTYYATVKNGPCSATDSIVITVDGTGIGESSFRNEIRIFPNPATNWITVTGKRLENTSFTVTIFNALGKVAGTFRNQHTLDLSGLPGGIYYLTLLTGNREYAGEKIILVK
ncbi:MAG: aryl-sulfate sulfotransferase [Bacteroidetes bacterium]|nr:aryl-sulfate sulfotransferase [Bacteroidota bacterium]